MTADLEFIPENGAGIRFRERKGEASERSARTTEHLKGRAI